MEFEEKVIDVEHIFDGHIVDLDVETVLTPEGQKATREIAYHANAVGVVIVSEDNKMLLVRQWRAPLRQETLEIIAGKLEPGENEASAVVRELNEEARLQAQSVEKLTSFYVSPGFTDEKLTLYHASGLSPVSEKLPQDEGEILNLEWLDIKEVQVAIAKGEICDAKTIMAVMLWQSLQ
ncbi:NUDIX hydrolase [Ligilactobacillus equi]|uniref:ADP-ribose pyrophosphatase n=1 Tax=Ligilactobacillus equi DPC 6820 TaxID=1392007 RepID=V7I0D0_9LACO|nr:NUDIX hydrolase [Ligilactobacillus equi]ETA74893.1 ADP-ribose pyrophosphatase [Ligilactobacillus equi DPC 6820]MCQ2556378.1 NUDIX hydrolase [Ligilactobacillus sp.]